MVRVEVSVSRMFRLRLAPDETFALLSDVPRWGALFPNVERIEPYPDDYNAFLWTMAPIGPPGAAVQIVYACSYNPDAEARMVGWRPTPGVGNAAFDGIAVLDPAPGGGTAGTFQLHAVLDIPAPPFVRALVVPAVKLEFGRMLDTFVARLEAL